MFAHMSILSCVQLFTCLFVQVCLHVNLITCQTVYRSIWSCPTVYMSFWSHMDICSHRSICSSLFSCPADASNCLHVHLITYVHSSTGSKEDNLRRDIPEQSSAGRGDRETLQTDDSTETKRNVPKIIFILLWFFFDSLVKVVLFTTATSCSSSRCRLTAAAVRVRDIRRQARLSGTSSGLV